LKAYSLIHALLTKRGLKPKLQKLDNEASLMLKTFLEVEEVECQLVPPHVHRRNKAEADDMNLQKPLHCRPMYC
jgi:hypothetical protein